MRFQVRGYFQRKLEPYLPYLTVNQAQKYMAISRTIYFFSAASILLLVWHAKGEYEKKLKEDSGELMIKDKSPAHEKLRRGGVKAGLISEYKPGEGWKLIEYDRDEYLLEMEKETLKRVHNKWLPTSHGADDN